MGVHNIEIWPTIIMGIGTSGEGGVNNDAVKRGPFVLVIFSRGKENPGFFRVFQGLLATLTLYARLA